MLGARWLKKQRQRTHFCTRQSEQSLLDLRNATATTGGTGYAVAGAFALAIRAFTRRNFPTYVSIRCEHGMFAKLLQELEARRAQLGGSPHYPSARPVLRGKLTRTLGPLGNKIKTKSVPPL